MNTQDLRDEMSGVERRIHLTNDYTTGGETFEKGSIGMVIGETTRKGRKYLKIKFDKDTKNYRLIRKHIYKLIHLRMKKKWFV